MLIALSSQSISQMLRSSACKPKTCLKQGKREEKCETSNVKCETDKVFNPVGRRTGFLPALFYGIKEGLLRLMAPKRRRSGSDRWEIQSGATP